jgi:hypothetical protein
MEAAFLGLMLVDILVLVLGGDGFWVGAGVLLHGKKGAFSESIRCTSHVEGASFMLLESTSQ